MTRILIADDHALVREGLRKVLEERPGWVVCGEAANGREAVAKCRELKPDVLVLDFAMPELNGLEVTRQRPCPDAPGRAARLVSAGPGLRYRGVGNLSGGHLLLPEL